MGNPYDAMLDEPRVLPSPAPEEVVSASGERVRDPLTTFDLCICLLLQLAGILIGASRISRGRLLNGFSMILLSLLSALAWNAIYVLVLFARHGWTAGPQAPGGVG